MSGRSTSLCPKIETEKRRVETGPSQVQFGTMRFAIWVIGDNGTDRETVITIVDCLLLLNHQKKADIIFDHETPRHVLHPEPRLRLPAGGDGAAEVRGRRKHQSGRVRDADERRLAAVWPC